MRPRPSWSKAHRIGGFERSFERYVRWLVRRSFAGVWLNRRAARLPSDGYVAIANHSSWWDGFIPYLLHRRQLPGSPFGLLMSDQELRRFPFFRWAGAFSIDNSSMRRAREAVVYAGEEARRGVGVWMFPQGWFAIDCEPRQFSSGFVHAARRGAAAIVPVALRFTMLEKQRPEVFIDIAKPLRDIGRGTARTAANIVCDRLRSIDDALRARHVEADYVRFITGASGVDAGFSSLLKRLRR
ncbi:MAG: lysophospholipid acyltransferase family protein [Candidatus Eremiobacteraeota bacterium]|nr:lysophospholipid acyltransferase family protein [Candidatus Eremiobacteraeota bacterium]